jgi:hypothetical protein
MTRNIRLAATIGVASLTLAPAFAAATPGNGHNPTPGPGASPHAKAKAYGKFCQGESKKHVAGTPGTPFSKCVTDMAKLANGSADSPRSACKNESKKHVAGMKGTPYSQCVSGTAKLQHDQQQQS